MPGVRYRITPALTVPAAGVVLGAGRMDYQSTSFTSLGRVAEQGPSVPVRLSFESECVLGVFGKRDGQILYPGWHSGGIGMSRPDVADRLELR